MWMAAAEACALLIEIARLQNVKVPVQERVGDVDAFHLGLGPSAPANLALRKRLGIPGAPFGGLGFIDPQLNVDQEVSGQVPPSQVTAELVRTTRLHEFRCCAEGKPSVYFWALQPVFDSEDHVVAAEVLVRARNGTDSAPFEDIAAIMDPSAPEHVRDVYVLWKVAEIIDWPLKVLKEHAVLQNLQHLMVNVRPLDLPQTSGIYLEVARRLSALDENDRSLLQRVVTIEVTEDQLPPDDLESVLQAWQGLGFSLSYDDTIGELACQVLEKSGRNFHTTAALEPLLPHFPVVKVDIDWAGFALFLSHPSYAFRPAVMVEVLRRARDEDLVCVPRGPTLRETPVAHSALLAEFAAWARDLMGCGAQICIELSVRQDNENNAHALGRLRSLGVDPFGVHKASFLFQGGPTGARAFEPGVLAERAEVVPLG
mmetsp:Transcript_124891/g.347718  ORF Transcript_124891/g.347718 Transcript_124891/m.347718 type:complete len:428 (+) Transcript_124891:58-1341(+)